MTRRSSRALFDLDDQRPFDARASHSQIRALLKLLGKRSRRILDLGCGAGRVLLPLAKAGHRVTGIDRRAELLMTCDAALKKARRSAELLRGDFRDSLPITRRFDAVLCLGNTFMTIADVDEAVALLSNIARMLAPRGLFIIDDLPREHWPELTSGNWQAGVSAVHHMQLVWHRSDAVFCIRRGRDVDRRKWDRSPSDVPLRLWCDGSLKLAAMAAGLSAPRRIEAGNLIVFARAPGPRGRRPR